MSGSAALLTPVYRAPFLFQRMGQRRFPRSTKWEPVECGVTEYHPDSLGLLRVVVAADFQEERVPSVFRAHGGAAIHPGEVRGKGLAELGVVRVRPDLQLVVFEILYFLRGVPVLLRDVA
eukprot:11870955-Heterocapsa_arctica.AAC.1